MKSMPRNIHNSFRIERITRTLLAANRAGIRLDTARANRRTQPLGHLIARVIRELGRRALRASEGETAGRALRYFHCQSLSSTKQREGRGELTATGQRIEAQVVGSADRDVEESR